jgi:hypothetical protein
MAFRETVCFLSTFLNVARVGGHLKPRKLLEHRLAKIGLPVTQIISQFYVFQIIRV